MDQARDRVAAAPELFAAGHLEAAVSAAYYAMLYAARAALSEHEEYARRHGGTWSIFTGVLSPPVHSTSTSIPSPSRLRKLAREVTMKRLRRIPPMPSASSTAPQTLLPQSKRCLATRETPQTEVRISSTTSPHSLRMNLQIRVPDFSSARQQGEQHHPRLRLQLLQPQVHPLRLLRWSHALVGPLRRSRGCLLGASEVSLRDCHSVGRKSASHN